MEYRLVLPPSGELETTMRNQLRVLARKIYNKDTDDVIFRIKTVAKYTNPRKLFVPGNGRIIQIKVPPHLTVSQKIQIDEQNEELLISLIKKVLIDIKSFALITSYVGDYGENFTIFVAFETNKEVDSLINSLKNFLSDYFTEEKEKRDILHSTLIYDDASKENINKARQLINKEALIKQKLLINSVWLWKNKHGWQPYKEFKLR
jgi:2'-5' RNA ligase